MFWLQNCLAEDVSLRCIDMRYYIAAPKPTLQYVDVSNCLLPHLLPHITDSEQGNKFLLFCFCLICQTFPLPFFSAAVYECVDLPLANVSYLFLSFDLSFDFHLLKCYHWWDIDTHLGGGSQGNNLYFLFVSLNFCISIYLLIKWKQDTYFGSKMLYETLMTTISD